ncbi:MAG TPA: ABC transporter permease [Vicinamibacterales bacterium]
MWIRTPNAVMALLALHALVLFADPLAPDAPDRQHRDLALAPPTRLHFVDTAGRWHLRPLVYPFWMDPASRAPREDPSRAMPLQLWSRGAPYRLGGLVGWDRHLLGVDEPARLFLLGTDRYGRDLLSRLVIGARPTLYAGLMATVIALGLGIVIGTVAGYHGGWLDGVLMWLTDACLSLPWFYLLLALRSLLPLDLSPVRTFLLTAGLVGAVGWARPARLIRAVVLSERDGDHVLAARSCGATAFRVLARHVMPQAIGVAVTQAALLAPRYVLAEITLSFLGLGVAEPTASWGTLTAGMIPPGLVLSHWWLAAPLGAIVAVVALYDRAARDIEKMPRFGRAPRPTAEAC